MRAARLHSIGGTLQLDELPDPEAGEGEELVDIAFARLRLPDEPFEVLLLQSQVLMVVVITSTGGVTKRVPQLVVALVALPVLAR